MKETLLKIKNGLVWFFKSFIWLVILVIILDQVSKLSIESAWLNYYDAHHAYPNWYIISPKFIQIKLAYNLGAAWSILNEHHWVLSVISVIASLGITAYLIYKYKKLGLWERICGYLILGGCIGNTIDRLFYSKGVIDFISTGFMNFPTFNIADSALVIGIIALMIKFIIDEVKGKKQDEKANNNNER